MSPARILVKTLLAFFLNFSLSCFVWFIALFFNPRTYSGQGGWNVRLICILFQLLFWGIAMLIFRKRDKEALVASAINLVIGLLFFIFGNAA